MHSVVDMRAGQAEEGQWEDRYFMYTTLDDNVGHVVHATLYTCEMKERGRGRDRHINSTKTTTNIDTDKDMDADTDTDPMPIPPMKHLMY